MDNSSKIEEDIHFPQIRNNRHFRIRSTSKDKLNPNPDVLTSKHRRKGSTDDTRRIFSENKNARNGSVQSCIKIRITKEEMQKKFNQKPSGKRIAYESVKTDQGHTSDEIKFVLSHLKTINHDNHAHNVEKHGQPVTVTATGSIKHKSNQANSIPSQQNRFKKQKPDRLERQGKGKYRCRVNQFIFDHSRKKSIHKEQQQTINQFWKNVNESLILGPDQPQEMSKDLREFVEYFPTE